MWIRNADGKKDAVLTMALVGFGVVLVKILLGGFVMKIAGKDFSFGTIDASAIGAVLTPTLGAYVARRYTDKKFGAEKESEVGEDGK